MLAYNGEIYNDIPSLQIFDHILRVLKFLNSAAEFVEYVTVLHYTLNSF